MIVVPGRLTDSLICEVDPNAIFADTDEGFRKAEKPNSYFKTYEFDGKEYLVNIGNSRYQVIKERKCVCCGVIGTRMFLCQVEEDDGEISYNFNLFAETRDRPHLESHLICLTQDHILPKSKGGDDDMDNLQCLCILCNNIKETLGVSINNIRSSIFSAYRIYRSSLTLNKTKEQMKFLYVELARFKRIVENVSSNLYKAKTDESRQVMLSKIERTKKPIESLENYIQTEERTAQTSGVVRDLSEEVQEILTHIRQNREGWL